MASEGLSRLSTGLTQHVSGQLKIRASGADETDTTTSGDSLDAM